MKLQDILQGVLQGILKGYPGAGAPMSQNGRTFELSGNLLDDMAGIGVVGVGLSLDYVLSD